ncbi:hypothetical protein [Tenacibaculum sp. SDUM215027]|uniref:hypothetical protein n=1 Tax=Tenacibaculum sp. SDUM215027 TaxID=3422596 RepID=UPI003D31067C
MIFQKTHTYTCILLFFLLACKSTSSLGQKIDNKYYTVFSELKEDNSSLNELFKKLKDNFNLCKVTESQKYIYKKYPKVFLEELSQNFENKAFLKVKNLKILSILSLKEKQEYNDLCISIEEWDFEKTNDASLVFNSLKKYREKEIKFNTINWIWLIYENHLYRISSDNHSVISVEMMKIKKHLTALLKEKGNVEGLTFYE